MEALLGTHVINGQGEKIPTTSLAGEGKIIGVYFSAHWCPPCRGFTPKLVDYYNKLKARNAPFEMVFISSDRDKNAFNEYFSEMPWLALDFDDRSRKETLGNKYGVRGIPTLIFLDGNTLEVVEANARGNVEKDPEGKGFPYKNKH